MSQAPEKDPGISPEQFASMATSLEEIAASMIVLARHMETTVEVLKQIRNKQ